MALLWVQVCIHLGVGKYMVGHTLGSCPGGWEIQQKGRGRCLTRDEDYQGLENDKTDTDERRQANDLSCQGQKLNGWLKEHINWVKKVPILLILVPPIYKWKDFSVIRVLRDGAGRKAVVLTGNFS